MEGEQLKIAARLGARRSRWAYPLAALAIWIAAMVSLAVQGAPVALRAAPTRLAAASCR